MKKLMTTTIVAFLTIALLVCGMSFLGNDTNRNISLMPAAQAQEKERVTDEDESTDLHRCSNKTAKGRYGFRTEGTILPGSPLPFPPGPYVSIGQVTLDGNGNISLTTNDNFNGTILPPATYLGTYTINNDCSGVAVFNNGVVFKLSVFDGGNEFSYMLDAPGTSVTGIAKKQ